MAMYNCKVYFCGFTGRPKPVNDGFYVVIHPNNGFAIDFGIVLHNCTSRNMEGQPNQTRLGFETVKQRLKNIEFLVWTNIEGHKILTSKKKSGCLISVSQGAGANPGIHDPPRQIKNQKVEWDRSHWYAWNSREIAKMVLCQDEGFSFMKWWHIIACSSWTTFFGDFTSIYLMISDVFFRK